MTDLTDLTAARVALATPAGAITESTAFKLHRATVLIDKLTDAYLFREHGIHYSQFQVLLMARILGPTTQQAIAANLDVSRASVTQRLAVLVKSELVTIAPDAADPRANRVTLTPTGLTLLDEAWGGLERHQDGLDAGVDEPALAVQLDRLIANALAALGSGNSRGEARTAATRTATRTDTRTAATRTDMRTATRDEQGDTK